MKRDLRIVFMGTPEFAVESLDILVKAGYNIVGVITTPDKQAGRGRKVRTSAVKDYANTASLNILQPVNLKKSDFHAKLKELKANLFVVVAFRMLPEVVWAMPEYGTFNLHGSLLPKYRGAAPINWAVINGETESGVSTFMLKHKIDTGDLMFQEKRDISENTTAGELHDELMKTGAELVLKTVKAIEQNIHPTIEQASLDVKPCPAPKIYREDCQIDWRKSSVEVHNLIRGLSPYPGAWSMIGEKQLKILLSVKSDRTIESGKIIKDNSQLFVGCGTNSVEILQVQLAGKKRMNTDDFLRGIAELPEKMGE